MLIDADRAAIPSPELMSMPNTNTASNTVASREAIALYVLTAFGVGLIGVAIVESSNASILLKRLLAVDYRLPLSMVVFASAGLLGALIWAFDGLHPPSHWFPSGSDDDPAPALRRVHRLSTAACLLALGVVLLHSFGPPVDRPLTDVFHEGEILAGSVILGNAAETPVLIHGPGRTLLPAALAAMFAQPGHEIAFMRLVAGVGRMMTTMLAALAAYAFAAALLEDLASPSRRHMIGAMVSLAAAAAVVFAAHATNRHVLILSALALCAGIFHNADRKRTQAHVLSAAFGAVCAVSPIHVYSTGLATLAIAVIAAGILLVHRGPSAIMLIGTALAGFAAGIALLLALGGGVLYANAVRDILWWGIEARGIWSLPLTGPRAMLDTVVVIGTIALAGTLALRKARSADPAERKRAALLFFLAAAVAVATRDMMDRSDASHTGYTLLSVAVGLGGLAALPILTMARRWPRLVAAGAALVAVVLGTATFAAGNGRLPSLASLNTPDESLLPDDIKQFVTRYGAELAGADCLLVLTNKGVLNYAAKRPPCGNFLYPVYAAVPAGDRALADWLRANPQRLAVIETDFFSDNIDNKPMRTRLPALWALIEATMKSREQAAGRTIALRR